MKIKLALIIVLILNLQFVFSNKAFAQAVELDTQQDIAIYGTGFYPFSDAANESFKSLLKESGSVAVIIKNLSGMSLKVAPAADYREIGRRKKVTSDGVVVINYTKKKAKRFGLSFVSKPTTINLEVQPFAGRPCPSPVNCQDDCGVNLGKCCEKNASGNQSKICVQVGTSSCGCANR